MRVGEYYNSNLLFKDLEKAETIIQHKIRINEFGPYDKYRWFLLYKDVNDEIKIIREMDGNNEHKFFDKKKKKKNE